MAATSHTNSPPQLYSQLNHHPKNLAHHLSTASDLSPNKHLAPSSASSHHASSSSSHANHKAHARRQSVARLLPDISKLRLLSWLVEASNELINCDIAIMDGVYAKLNRSRESSSNLLLATSNSKLLYSKQATSAPSSQHAAANPHHNRYSLAQIQNIMNSRPSSCRLPTATTTRANVTNQNNANTNRSPSLKQQSTCKNNNYNKGAGTLIGPRAPLAIGVAPKSSSSDSIIMDKQQQKPLANQSDSNTQTDSNNSMAKMEQTGASGLTTSSSKPICEAQSGQNVIQCAESKQANNVNYTELAENQLEQSATELDHARQTPATLADAACDRDKANYDADDKHNRQLLIGTNCDQANEDDNENCNNSDNKTDDKTHDQDEAPTTISGQSISFCGERSNNDDVCDIKTGSSSAYFDSANKLKCVQENAEAESRLANETQIDAKTNNCANESDGGVKLCNEHVNSTPAQQTPLEPAASSSLPANYKCSQVASSDGAGAAAAFQQRQNDHLEPRTDNDEYEDDDEDEDDDETSASSTSSSGIHGGATSLTLSSTSGSNDAASCASDDSLDDQQVAKQQQHLASSSISKSLSPTKSSPLSNQIFAQRLSHAASISQAAAEAAAQAASMSAPSSLPPIRQQQANAISQIANQRVTMPQSQCFNGPSRAGSFCLQTSHSSLLKSRQISDKQLQQQQSMLQNAFLTHRPTTLTQSDDRSSAEILSEKVRKSVMEHNYLQSLLVNVIRHYDRLRLLQAQQRRRFYNANTSSDDIEEPAILQKRIDLVEITRLLDDACLCSCHSNQLANMQLINKRTCSDLQEQKDDSSCVELTRKNKLQQQAPVPVPVRKLRRFKKSSSANTNCSDLNLSLENADSATTTDCACSNSTSPTIDHESSGCFSTDSENGRFTRTEIIRQMPDKLCANCFDTHYWLYPCLVMDQSNRDLLAIPKDNMNTISESSASSFNLTSIGSPPRLSAPSALQLATLQSGPTSLIDLHANDNYDNFNFNAASSDSNHNNSNNKSAAELISELNSEILKRNATFLKLVQQRVSSTIRESLNLIELIRKEIKSPESIKQKQLMRCFSASIQLLSSVGNYVVSAQDIPTFIPDLGQTNNQNAKIFRLPQSDFDQQHPNPRSPIKSNGSSSATNNNQNQLDRFPAYGLRFNQHQDHYIQHDSAGSLRLVDSDYHLAAAPEIPIRRKFKNNQYQQEQQQQKHHSMPYVKSGDLHSLRSVSIISNSSNDCQTNSNINCTSSGLNSICSGSMISVRTNNSSSTYHQPGQTPQQQQYQTNNTNGMDPPSTAIQATANLQQQKVKQLNDIGEASSSGNSSTNSSASSSIARADVQQSCLARLRNNNNYVGGYHSPTAAARRPTYTIANDMNLTSNQSARNDLLWSFESRYGSLNSPLSSSRGKPTIDDIDLLDAVAAHESNRKFWQSPKFNFIKKLLRVKEQRLLRQQSKDRRIYNNKVQNKFRLVMMDLSHFNKSQQLLTTENGVNSLLTSMRHVLEFGLFLTVKLY